MGFSQTINACELTSKPALASKRIKSLNDEEITVYPNPSQGNLTVNLNVEKGQVVLFELYDVLGKKHDELKLTEGNLHQLNLSQVQHGIYFYRLLNNSTVLKSGKLILQ